MEILNGDKVPLGDNKGATGEKLYLRHNSAHSNVTSFLDLYAHIYRTTLINLESFTKEEHSSALEKFSHHPISLSFTEVILASLTPITEECTKLLDRLSEPSSRLIHHVSHPYKEDISAEVVTACFICIRVHGLPVASLLSV